MEKFIRLTYLASLKKRKYSMENSFATAAESMFFSRRIFRYIVHFQLVYKLFLCVQQAQK